MKIDLKKIIDSYLEASNFCGKVMSDYYYQNGAKNLQKRNKNK